MPSGRILFLSSFRMQSTWLLREHYSKEQVHNSRTVPPDFSSLHLMEEVTMDNHTVQTNSGWRKAVLKVPRNQSIWAVAFCLNYSFWGCFRRLHCSSSGNEGISPILISSFRICIFCFIKKNNLSTCYNIQLASHKHTLQI